MHDPTGAGLKELLHHQPLLSFDHKGQPIDVKHENPDTLPKCITEANIFVKKNKPKKLKKQVDNKKKNKCHGDIDSQSSQFEDMAESELAETSSKLVAHVEEEGDPTDENYCMNVKEALKA